MKLSDFDFELPEDRIALRPASPRDAARMLVVRPDAPLLDAGVSMLPDWLSAGDILVFNDTRVINARLKGVRERDGRSVAVEATLHRRLSSDRWTAFMRPGKRLQPGDRISFGEIGDRACFLGALEARLVEKAAGGGEVVLAFDLAGPDLDLAIAERGVTPLPPYIASKRHADDQDRVDYQTVYARHDGSVAAPTAGLHFTPDLMRRLADRGVTTAFVTLHVGAGTFLPVKTDDIADHVMHAEYGDVSVRTAEVVNAAREAGGRVACVGTTSLRLLESAADEDGRVRPFAGETSIFIRPGYRFRAADILMTNFHLPKSTLFMLVSAFAGEEAMRGAYGHAIRSGYRFYSYGDASLLFRAA
ncbi:MAG TPA: tRNA preQ1(34) S-adenosylmethionine ribosyltransferase-isomerase QueA [Caulobacteraceae bacterium]|jgi:S-adenosylmethionine:tRNA ribosyltransferase-isomerase|nr:tRNA preQ1(34) S-adenosylmethionine ribosyltransferase-isomerase QueA [Caulobacteraceae bacterium]